MLSDLGHIQDPHFSDGLEGKTNIRAKCQRHISRSDHDWKPQQAHGGQSCRQSLILVIDKQCHQCKSTTTAKHPTTTRAIPADCAHRKSKWWTRGSEQRHERRVKETGLAELHSSSDLMPSGIKKQILGTHGWWSQSEQAFKCLLKSWSPGVISTNPSKTQLNQKSAFLHKFRFTLDFSLIISTWSRAVSKPCKQQAAKNQGRS